MIRVLVFGFMNDILGGIETYIKELCLNSSKDKIHFDFVVKGRRKAIFEKEITEFYNGKNHFFHVTKLKENPVRCIREMGKIYKRGYTAIYINSTVSSDILYALLYVGKKVPKIIIHSHYAANYAVLPNSLFRKLAVSRSDLRLACSHRAAVWMYGAKAVKNGKVKIINNGINTGRFTYSLEKRKIIRDKYGVRDEDILIGHIGRLDYQKNQVFLLEILKEILILRKEDTEGIGTIKLLLAGDGPDKEMLLRQIKRDGLENYVIMPGVVSKAECYYSAFDLFVMPSHHEGLPLAGIEAQCEGLYCFFSDVIDRQLLITDRAQMIHLEENNQAEWAKIILKVCKNKLTVGRERYSDIVRSKGYEIKDVCAGLEEILLDVCNGYK
ncbi:MAG: glycosyltransferase [Clostridium sp.]|nr:glycosyltransferase [Clostridium sp.]